MVTPTGLSVWFANDVTVSGDVYTFNWDGSSEKAKLLSKKQGKHVKFQWLDRAAPETFSFEIIVDELTSDVAMLISDYEDEDMIEEAKQIYSVCIDKLRHTIGG
jgi:hypothetical protein